MNTADRGNVIDLPIIPVFRRREIDAFQAFERSGYSPALEHAWQAARTNLERALDAADRRRELRRK